MINLKKFHAAFIKSQQDNVVTPYLATTLHKLAIEKAASHPSPVQDNSFISTTPHDDYIAELLTTAYLRLVKKLPILSIKDKDPLQLLTYLRTLLTYAYLSYNSFYHRKNSRTTKGDSIQAQEYDEALLEHSTVTAVYTYTDTDSIIHPLTQQYIEKHADEGVIQEYNLTK
jgi:hypothetical protein